MLGESALDRHRRLHGIDGPVETDEESVPGVADLRAVDARRRLPGAARSCQASRASHFSSPMRPTRSVEVTMSVNMKVLVTRARSVVWPLDGRRGSCSPREVELGAEPSRTPIGPRPAPSGHESSSSAGEMGSAQDHAGPSTLVLETRSRASPPGTSEMRGWPSHDRPRASDQLPEPVRAIASNAGRSVLRGESLQLLGGAAGGVDIVPGQGHLHLGRQ